MTKEELLEQIKSEFVKIIDNEEVLKINVKDGIDKDYLLSILKSIFDYEVENDLVFLDLKGLPISLISESVKYALTREDLRDPYMLLNIINLIKIYNTLDDSFFENEHIYVSSIEDLLDIKLELSEDLAKFQKQLSIYFISLFKSFNKTSYEPLDKHIDLPETYKNIIMSLDILTLSGIFSVSEPFMTSDCIYINSANLIMFELLAKGSLSAYLMNNLLGEKSANITT